MDCHPPGFFVRGISQARTLEWVAISSSRGYSRPRHWTYVSCLAGGFFTTEPPGKPILALFFLHLTVESTSSLKPFSSPAIEHYCLLLPFPVFSYEKLKPAEVLKGLYPENPCTSHLNCIKLTHISLFTHHSTLLKKEIICLAALGLSCNMWEL